MRPVALDPATERLSVTLLIAAVLHMLAIYQLRFTPPQSLKSTDAPIDIILVQKSTAPAPEQAHYLAQATQAGGGENLSKERPATPMIAPFPDQQADHVITPPPPETAAAFLLPDIEHLLTQQASDYQIVPPKQADQLLNTALENGQETQTTPWQEEIPTSTLMMNIRTSLASLQAELNEKFSAYAKNMRRTYISASTQAYKYAHYMEAWRRRVEHIGTQYYAKASYNKTLSGSLILEVAINANGTIHQVILKQSSGHAKLDDAARRIVHRSAPFAPFPEEIRQETDVLHITRTWEFFHDGLTSR